MAVPVLNTLSVYGCYDAKDAAFAERLTAKRKVTPTQWDCSRSRCRRFAVSGQSAVCR